MRIAAVNIPAGWFPHIFGENHKDVTINFGGKNIYTFDDDRISSVSTNPFFLDDIFGESVSLFSCVVGQNGIGKSTLLRLLTANEECTYVIEVPDGSYTTTHSLEKIHRIYFTPYLHHAELNAVGINGKDLSKLAIMKLDNHFERGSLDDLLDAHTSENTKRWIKFNHFYRQLPPSTILLPVFHRVKIALGHFDVTVHKPDSFNDTSMQLRPAIKLLFNKIKSDEEIKEREVGEIEGLNDRQLHLLVFDVRFEYELYEAALGKMVSILERKGNRYLNEGYIPADYRVQIEQRSVREAIEWFLSNAGVELNGVRYSFDKHLSLLDLIDFVLSLNEEENRTDNWREIVVHEIQALGIIERYDAFNNSFINDWFEFDAKPMFGLFPDITVSSGEQNFLNFFSVLYFHAQNISAGVDIDIHSSETLEDIGEDILLLLDEGDNAFHPQWKKEYVKYLKTIVPQIYEGYNIQIVVTSHDPLTLSDMPKNNVVFLERGEKGTIVGKSSQKRTFAANIADLLKDSFFIQDGLIGGFVSDVIDQVISDIRGRQLTDIRVSQIERIIEAIDEPIIKIKLAEMLVEAGGDQLFQRRLIEKEIARLEEIRRRL